MALTLRERSQRKVLRSLTRLKYSLAADAEIDALEQERVRIGAEGAAPQLETTLEEILSVGNDAS